MGTVFLYSASNPLPLYLLGNIALIIFLLLAGAFFSSTETAFTALSKIRARQMVKDGKKNSVLVTRLRNNLDFLIATVLVGTNFVNTLNSAVVTAFAIRVFGPESVTIMTSVILVLVIIFVEIVPKTYAVYYPERICSNSARKIWLIEIAIWPLIKVFCFFTSFIDVVEQKLIKSNRQLVTEEELKTLIEVGEKEGTLEVSERKMLDRLFEFSDITVHTIMRHRSLVKYISVDDSLDSVLALFQSTGYSKIPVYENDIEKILTNFRYVIRVPKDRNIAALSLRMKDFGGILGFSSTNYLTKPGALFIKRSLDIAACLLASPLLILATIVISIIIKITSPGPVFFGHKRVGRYHKEIKCWKFRSMVNNSQEMLEHILATDPVRAAEWEKDRKFTDDPRVTKFGKFLRKTSLDELPQLWNVFTGEMSLIGPRPVTVPELEKYGKYTDYVLSVKPGLSGMWQISGRSDTGYEERINLDTYYIQNWSVWIDLWILIKTIAVVLKGKGAY